MLRSTEESQFNAIDPNLLVDGDNRWWLTFGSYNLNFKNRKIFSHLRWSNGIYQIELIPNDGKIKLGTKRNHLAARDAGIEAPFIIHRGQNLIIYQACSSHSTKDIPCSVHPMFPTYYQRCSHHSTKEVPFALTKDVPFTLETRSI